MGDFWLLGFSVLAISTFWVVSFRCTSRRCLPAVLSVCLRTAKSMGWAPATTMKGGGSGGSGGEPRSSAPESSALGRYRIRYGDIQKESTAVDSNSLNWSIDFLKWD